MYKDPEPELTIQADDTLEEFSVETTEIDMTTQLHEKLISWLDIIDR